MSANRLGYIDAIRGFTMILVVYGHVVIFLLDKSAHLSSNVNEIFVLFTMPLFFFISGFFAYSSNYDWKLFKRRSFNRIVKQLYPTVILWIIFCWIFRPGDLTNWIFDIYKSGYWFTFVAVEMFFTVTPILLILSSLKLSSIIRSICLLSFCAIIEMCHRYITPPSGFNEILCLWLYYSYIPFFIMGMIVKIQHEQFNRISSNRIFVLGASIIFILSIVLSEYPLMNMVSAISGIIIIYSIFFYLENLNHPIVTKIYGVLSIIGTSTLEIYLLHYYFVFSFRDIFNLNFLASLCGTNMEFPVYFILSVLICAICLISVKLFKKIHINGILFPSLSLYSSATKKPDY